MPAYNIPQGASLSYAAMDIIDAAMLEGVRPRCRFCGRRLKRAPWKYLGIGPVCIKRHRIEHPDFPQILAEQRMRFADIRRERVGDVASRAEIEALDAELRKIGIYG